jgi:hypothetical protein
MLNLDAALRKEEEETTVDVVIKYLNGTSSGRR